MTDLTFGARVARNQTEQVTLQAVRAADLGDVLIDESDERLFDSDDVTGFEVLSCDDVSAEPGVVLELQTVDDERDLLVGRIRQLESLPLDIFLIEIHLGLALSFALLESFKDLRRASSSLSSELHVVLKYDDL